MTRKTNLDRQEIKLGDQATKSGRCRLGGDIFIGYHLPKRLRPRERRFCGDWVNMFYHAIAHIPAGTNSSTR